MKDNEEFTMPFTGHKPHELHETLTSINHAAGGLTVEAFDAFLAEYARTKDLDKAWGFAVSEWDL